jgi:5-methylcytosine-specific restriction endonuclease McrA
MQQIKPTPVKHCLQCGSKMERNRFASGRREDLAVFNRRKYCNRKCMASAMVQEDPTRDAYRKRIRHLREEQCGDCGSIENLSINHKDRNWRNNQPDNLETLCSSCHTKKHWDEPGRLFVAKWTPCKICGEKSRRHGYCQKHYFRVKKHGDPHTVIRGGKAVRVAD